jgi:PTS system ascorbate-specific IIA component
VAALLIVAHAPLASALLAAARHVYAEKLGAVGALDIAPELSAEQAQDAVRAALAALAPAGGAPGAVETLVLVDVFGATPCRAVQAVVAELPRVRLVAGVNVPMLWRALCYADEVPLDVLVERAVGGAQQGVLPVGTARRQNQPGRALADDQVQHHDQQ